MLVVAQVDSVRSGCKKMRGPLAIAVSMIPLLTAVLCASEFTAHRMIQFDRGTAKHGARRATLNLEAGSTSSPNLARRVVVVHMHELTTETVQIICSGSFTVGGLLIVLPLNTSEVGFALLHSGPRSLFPSD